MYTKIFNLHSWNRFRVKYLLIKKHNFGRPSQGEARVQQLQALDLHPLDEDVRPRILDELHKCINDSDYAWRVHEITLKLQSRYTKEWERTVPRQTTAVLVPFQCEFEVLIGYEFYAKHIFEGTPPPKPKNVDGEVLRGWFPIQTHPSEFFICDIFLIPKFDQSRGLVMSDLPFP